MPPSPRLQIPPATMPRVMTRPSTFHHCNNCKQPRTTTRFFMTRDSFLFSKLLQFSLFQHVLKSNVLFTATAPGGVEPAETAFPQFDMRPNTAAFCGHYPNPRQSKLLRGIPGYGGQRKGVYGENVHGASWVESQQIAYGLNRPSTTGLLRAKAANSRAQRQKHAGSDVPGYGGSAKICLFKFKILNIFSKVHSRIQIKHFKFNLIICILTFKFVPKVRAQQDCGALDWRTFRGCQQSSSRFGQGPKVRHVFNPNSFE